MTRHSRIGACRGFPAGRQRHRHPGWTRTWLVLVGLASACLLLVPAAAEAQEGNVYDVTLKTIEKETLEACFEFLDIGVLRVTEADGVSDLTWERIKNGRHKKSFLGTGRAACVDSPEAESCGQAIAGKVIAGGSKIKGDVFAEDFFQATYRGKRVNECPIVPDTAAGTYQGSVAGPGFSARIEVTVQDDGGRFGAGVARRADLPASGVLRLVTGEVVRLFGTFNDRRGELSLEGGGYLFEGTRDGSVINGTFTGPDGIVGSFSAVDTRASSATTFCGTYGGDESGVFNMVIHADGNITGTWANVDGSSGTFWGQLNGTSITVTTNDGSTATGTLQGDTVSGTVTNGNQSGTWRGDTSCGS